ncbi:hypothetical protein GQ44DRAFT_604872 [Phaeosphaeriaceae sp. PMI808]|nr:hypothetical protein GQ44DRAFT_604872 [Phaeosphaeriaceae sp. PMI808]
MSVACPFGGNACVTDAVRFDSGLVDSNKDVGLNSPPKDGLSFRRVTTCAPIKVERYATKWHDNLTEQYGKQGSTGVKFYEFGKGDSGCEATSQQETTNLTTFCISQWMKDYLPQAYHVIATTAYTERPNASDFNPISDFHLTDADVTLLSIFNKARYNGKVDDALFNAQVPIDGGEQWFSPTTDLDILGCTEQYQFCNTQKQKCTNLTGLYATQNSINRGDLALSKRQMATFSVMWQAGWAMSLQWAVKILSSRVLLAQEWLFTSTSIGSSWLPGDQWQQEAFNIHNLSLSIFQHRVNQHSTPETFEIRQGVNASKLIDTPTDPDVLALCERQRILSGRHYSVSVLGMAIILCVGSLLVITDQAIEAVWARFFTAPWQLEKREEWTQTGTLQLHRQALEARGIGTWDRTNRDFPVIEAKGKIFTTQSRPNEESDRTFDHKSGYHAVTNEIPLHGQTR